MNQKLSDRDFISMVERLGMDPAARELKADRRGMQRRRREIEKKTGGKIVVPTARRDDRYPHRLNINIKDGEALICSDGHYWPGDISTAHRAFVKFCEIRKPHTVVMNGDAFDGATISRHAKIGWESTPTVKEEVEAVKERLGEIERAAGNANKIWTLGNHDGRFETRLAMVAPEYARIHGVHLSDHFPAWTSAWSAWINDDVIIKHRFKGGTHATHNATLTAGKTMITGHLHSLKVTPYSDYNGTRYGVDTGCLADPYGRQFVDYTEDNPRSHRAGFVLLTFHEGQLLMPELVAVYDENHVQFRGKVLRV